MAAETYTTSVELTKHMTAFDALNGLNPLGNLPAGTYCVYKKAGNAYNLSKSEASAGAWVDVSKDVKKPGIGRKFNIHAGHNPDGKPACGATGIIKESTEARNIIFWLKYYLEKWGATVYDCTCNDGVATKTRTSQQNVLDKIIAKDNAHSVDISLSIHFNSGRSDKVGDNKVGGMEMYATTYSNEKISYSLQIKKKLEALGLTTHGNFYKESKTLRFLKETKNKALLLEVCFVDDRDDCNWYKQTGPEAIGRAIAEGLLGI